MSHSVAKKLLFSVSRVVLDLDQQNWESANDAFELQKTFEESHHKRSNHQFSKRNQSWTPLKAEVEVETQTLRPDGTDHWKSRCWWLKVGGKGMMRDDEGQNQLHVVVSCLTKPCSSHEETDKNELINWLSSTSAFAEISKWWPTKVKYVMGLGKL